MDKYERRRARLQELIRVGFHDRQARFADAIGKSASYVSRMLYEPGKKGRKRIAEDMQEHIERECKLVPGWLDMEPGTPIMHTKKVQEPAAKYEAAPTWPFEKITQKQWDALTANERAVVEGVALAILGRISGARRSAGAGSLQPA